MVGRRNDKKTGKRQAIYSSLDDRTWLALSIHWLKGRLMWLAQSASSKYLSGSIHLVHPLLDPPCTYVLMWLACLSHDQIVIGSILDTANHFSHESTSFIVASAQKGN